MLAFQIALPVAVTAHQASEQDSDRDQARAHRFLKVLLDRPRPGIALDHVYEYHVRKGNLDKLLLALQSGKEQSNQKQTELTFDVSNVDPSAASMVVGLIQLQRGKFDLAIAALKRAEQLRPDDAGCSFYLGKAFLAKGETSLAAKALERAIERGPRRNEALPMFTELGRIYSRAGLNDKALTVWTKLETLFPGDLRVGGQIASILADEGKLEEALTRFQSLAKSADKDEDEISFAVKAVEIKRRLDRPEEATADLETLLKRVRPGSWLYADLRNRIEEGFRDDGDISGLAEYYQRQIKDDPDNLELMMRLGRVLISANRLNDAKDVLENAVERAPQEADVRLALIDLLIRRAQISEAARHYEVLSKQDPTHPDYLLTWGQLLLDDGTVPLADRRRSAAKIWQRLADAKGADPVTQVQVAGRMKSIAESEAAISLYRRAVDLAEADVQYREYLGEYLHQLERNDEAIQVWESIAEGDRRNVLSLIRLAEIYRTFNLPKRSLATWKAAAEFDLTFGQELRYAQQLRTSQHYEAAVQRLVAAEQIAESPDEENQLLAERIETFVAAGTLQDEIITLRKQTKPSVKQLRQLALMQQAAGMLAQASVSIQAALDQSPEDQALLLTSAELLEQQNQIASAAECYQKLALADRRYRTTHLEKVVQLQIQLGLIDDAMKTCHELIKANPASVDTYLFAAARAFQLGRNDEADAILGRAISVGRTDNRPRLLLANNLARRYRTPEAIDLYWQAFEFEDKLDKRKDIVRALAMLYDRRANVDTLLKRLEETSGRKNSFRSTQLLIAAAHEALRNPEAARKAISRILDRHPQDVESLKMMVRFSIGAKNPKSAAEFQQRIVTLNDSSENRLRLLNLKIDAGMIDIQAAWAERLELVQSPFQIMKMIQSAVRQGDRKAAKLIARQAIENDDSLWDVKLYLAQLLLRDIVQFEHLPPQSSDATDANDKAKQEVIRLCGQVLADVGFTKAQLIAPTQNLAAVAQSPANQPIGPRDAFGRLILAKMQQWANSNLNVYPNGVAVAPSTPTAKPLNLTQHRGSFLKSSLAIPIQVTNDSEARILAIVSKWMAECPKQTASEKREWMKTNFRSTHSIPDHLSRVTGISRLMEHQVLQQVANQSPEPLGFSMSDFLLRFNHPLTSLENAPPEEPDHVKWRIFELHPDTGIGQIHEELVYRFLHRNRDVTNVQPPLAKTQLESLVDFLEQIPQPQQSATTISAEDNFQSISLAACLKSESLLADRPDLTARCEDNIQQRTRTNAELECLVSFYVAMLDQQTAEEHIKNLLPTLRKDVEKGVWNPGSMLQPLTLTGAGTAWRNWYATGDYGNADTKRNRIDLILAESCYRQTLLGVNSLEINRVRLVPAVGGGSISYKRFPVPCSSQLLAPSVIRYLDVNSPERLELIAHLQKPLANSPVAETKSRLVLAAFLHWWNEDPGQCCESLESLTRMFPDDALIQLEYARLLVETKQHQKALTVLHSIPLLGAEARMASQLLTFDAAKAIPDLEQAQAAGKQLVGMKLSPDLAKQLVVDFKKLDMTSELTQLMTRNAIGKQISLTEKLGMASMLQSKGKSDEAFEIAFEIFREASRQIRTRSQAYRSSGRVISSANPMAIGGGGLGGGSGYSITTQRRSGRGSAADMVQHPALKIMKATGRLEGVIKQQKKRLEAAPKSSRLRIELSQLYRGNDQVQEAVDVLKASPVLDKQIVAEQILFGQTEMSSKNYSIALQLFLDAARSAPETLNVTQGLFKQAASIGGQLAQVKENLQSIPSVDVPITILQNLLAASRYQTVALDKAERQFLEWVFHQRPANQDLYQLCRFIPEEERAGIPALRNAILASLEGRLFFDSHSVAWQATSNYPWGFIGRELQVVLDFICADEEIRTAFDRRCSELREDPKLGQTSALLQAVVQFWSESVERRTETDELPSTKRLFDVLARINLDFDTPHDTVQHQTSTDRIDNSLLLQIAGVIDKSSMESGKNILLKAVFEKCSVPKRIGSVQVNESYLPKYLMILRQQQEVEKAVALLQQLSDRTHKPVAIQTGSTTMGPGWGPGPATTYMMTSNTSTEDAWIAQQLFDLSAPVEALIVSHQGYNPDRNLPHRNSRPTKTQTELKVNIQRAERSLTPKAASNYVRRLASRVQSSGSVVLPPMMFQPVDVFHSHQSTFLSICELAASTEDGRQHLVSLLAGLTEELSSKLAVPQPDRLSLVAASVTVASALKSDQLGTLSQLAVGEIESVSAKPTTPGRTVRAKVILVSPTDQKSRRARECLSMLIAVSKYDSSTRNNFRKPLSQAVCRELQKANDLSVVLSVAEAFGATSETIDQLRQLLIAEIKPSSMSLRRLMERLSANRNAALAGRIHASCFELQVLLSPESLETADRDVMISEDLRAFALGIHSWKQSRSSEDKAVVKHVHEIIVAYEATCDVEGSAASDKNDTKDGSISTDPLQPAVTNSNRQLVLKTLRDIVFESAVANDVNPYLKQVVPSIQLNAFGQNFTKDGLPEFTSASQMLIRLAAETGRLDEIGQQIQGSSLNCLVMQTQVALQRQDADRIAILLTELEQLLDSFLPAADAKLLISNSLSTGNASEEEVKASALKAKATNAILHCTWSVVNDANYKDTEADRLARILLRRSVAAMRSDQYTTNRLYRVSKVILDRLDRVEAENQPDVPASGIDP